MEWTKEGKDAWGFQAWQEVSLAEEAAGCRMVRDEGTESLGKDGEKAGDQGTQGVARQGEALAWNEREAKSRFVAGRNAQNSIKVEAGLHLLRKLVPGR